MPSTITGLDSAKILKPSLLLQLLGGVKKPETEVMDTVFKKKKNVPGDKVSRNITTRTIRAVPYTAQNNAGVPLYGRTDAADGITAPPMKCHHRIMAVDFERIKNLRGVEQRAALAEEMQYVKDTIAWNMEWFARHFLSTGNCDYPYLLEGNAIADSIVYSLGTMSSVSAPSVLFDNASATLAGVIAHLDLMLKAGQDVANRNHFNDPSKIVTYVRTAVWNHIFDIMDGKQTNNVITGKRLDTLTLDVGGYLLKKFDANTVSPVDQSADVGIPVKQMRMIDLGGSAPHTMAGLELANLKAKGGQKHVLILPIEDVGGDYVDILVRWRPVGMPIPEAIVSSGDCIA